MTVDQKRFAGMIHGVLYMPAVIAKANEAIDDIAAALRASFAD